MALPSALSLKPYLGPLSISHYLAAGLKGIKADPVMFGWSSFFAGSVGYVIRFTHKIAPQFFPYYPAGWVWQA